MKVTLRVTVRITVKVTVKVTDTVRIMVKISDHFRFSQAVLSFETDPKFFILYMSVRCICLISQTSESNESGENLYIQDPCSVCGFLYPI